MDMIREGKAIVETGMGEMGKLVRESKSTTKRTLKEGKKTVRKTIKKIPCK